MSLISVGISDLKKVNINATLAELGMDSIVATSIKQTLEREFNKSISFQDLRRQTLAGYAITKQYTTSKK